MKMRMLAAAALAMLVLPSCISEGNVERKLANTFCDRYEECARGDFEEDYTSQNDCREEESDGNLVDCFEEAGCEFQPDKAADCRSAAASASCEDFVDGEYFDDGCDEIYDCTDEQAADAARCSLGF